MNKKYNKLFIFRNNNIYKLYMSGFKSITYNNNPLINSFYDIATINLPSTQTYTTNQYNILAPTINGTPGYVLKTNNNIISLDSSGGFSINNSGIYKITMCFTFFNSNTDSNEINVDVMLNNTYLSTPTSIKGITPCLDTYTSGTVLSFPGLTNNSLNIDGESISDNYVDSGFIPAGDPPQQSNYLYLRYVFYTCPSIMYYSTYFLDSYQPTDPAFYFSRYYLSTNNEKYIIPQVLYFTMTIQVNNTSGLNYFYPCICPYDYSIWNDGTANLPQPYLMVQMISTV